MTRPPRPAEAARLARMAALARLKAERAKAPLAETARSRARLLAALADLGAPDPPLSPAGPPPAGLATGTDPQAIGAAPGPDGIGAAGRAGVGGPAPPPAPAGVEVSPHLVRARLAHRAWVEARRSTLLARLARIEADWRRLLPPAAAAFGRAEALDALTREAEAALARRRRAGGDPAGSPAPGGDGP